MVDSHSVGELEIEDLQPITPQEQATIKVVPPEEPLTERQHRYKVIVTKQESTKKGPYLYFKDELNLVTAGKIHGGNVKRASYTPLPFTPDSSRVFFNDGDDGVVIQGDISLLGLGPTMVSTAPIPARIFDADKEDRSPRHYTPRLGNPHPSKLIEDGVVVRWDGTLPKETLVTYIPTTSGRINDSTKEDWCNTEAEKYIVVKAHGFYDAEAKKFILIKENGL